MPKDHNSQFKSTEKHDSELNSSEIRVSCGFTKCLLKKSEQNSYFGTFQLRIMPFDTLLENYGISVLFDSQF